MDLITKLNPFRLFRNYILFPWRYFFEQQYSEYKRRKAEGLNTFREAINRASLITVFFTAILWTSIFMYVLFYYTYMPNVTHVRPVHLQYKSCETDKGECSLPSAHVQLTKRANILMPAQTYRVRLVLDMPESQINKDLGMFMVCVQMRAQQGVLVSASCRSTMLRHRSKLHQWLRTLVMAPLLLSGLHDEQQRIYVDLFTDFEDDQNRPVTDAYVEVTSRSVQVYACELQIEAHFSGLRFIMYHWPTVSAVIAICTNLFFVSLVFLLSWYQLQNYLPDYIKLKTSDVKDEKKPLTGKLKIEKEDELSSIHDDFFNDLSLENNGLDQTVME